MDESKLAIKLVSDVQSSTEDAPDTAASLSVENAAVSEVVDLVPELRAATDITAPLMFIGGNGGSQYTLKGWTTGKVITKIRVYKGEYTIKAYTIWLTDSNGVTYGKPEGTNFAEYEFQNGERITQMTLWGNGVGTRAGWIKFVTSRGYQFSAGMYGRDPQTQYPVEVASGILVGCIFNAGSDIDAHGFYFLNAMESSELINVRYPTLDFDTLGIVPKVLDRFEYFNDSTNPKNWDFTRTMKESIQQTWSITVDVTVHATITVTAGIPLVAEVSGEFGWQVGVTSHHETSQTSEQGFNWSVSGIVKPGDRVDIKAVTRMGSLNVPYEATMVVKLKNGATFSYPMKGTYKGINYSGVQIVDNSTR